MLRTTAALTLALVARGCECACSQTVENTEQMLTEARSAWAKFRDGFVVKRALLLNEERHSRTEEIAQTKISIGLKLDRDDYVLIVETNDGEQWKGEVQGINDKYVFQLTRPQKESPWVLSSLGMRASSDELSDIQARVLRHKTTLSLFPLAINSVPLDELVSLPVFRATELVSDSTSSLVELAFRIDDPRARSKHGPRIGFHRGRLILDREKCWLPIRQELEWPSQEALIFELSQFHQERGLVYPRVSRGTRRERDGSEWVFSTMTVQELDFDGTVPRSEFTLSAFGLPEPGGTAPKLRPYLWLAGAAVVFVAVGIFLRRRARAVDP